MKVVHDRNVGLIEFASPEEKRFAVRRKGQTTIVRYVFSRPVSSLRSLFQSEKERENALRIRSALFSLVRSRLSDMIDYHYIYRCLDRLKL